MSPTPQTETEPICPRCGLWCLIAYKAHAIEAADGTRTWYHDAHKNDCWEQEIKARMERAEKRCD